MYGKGSLRLGAFGRLSQPHVRGSDHEFRSYSGPVRAIGRVLATWRSIARRFKKNNDRRAHEARKDSGFARDQMPNGYNARKAAQVIAFFAMKSGNKRLHVVKAIKLVYLGDRDSIANYGFPILDEPRVSMKHGPVNSTTYAHVNGEHDLERAGWSEFIRDRSQHQLSVVPHVTEDDLDELSDADIECLERVWERFGHMNEWQLRDWTHDRRNVPEWENPGSSSKIIPLERIMSVLGLEDPDQQAAIVAEQQQISDIFASLRR